MTKRDYVDVIYNERDRPFTSYPARLTRHLCTRYRLAPGQKILDVGCGRGEFLAGFIACGLKGYGLDRSRAAERICPQAELATAEIERNGIPHADATFDVVYSKSVIEHFRDPDILMSEIYRVLKPGGLVITMSPDWATNYRIFFEDYTHRTPFMRSSLRDIHVIHGFEDVHVERFRQLPVLWDIPALTAAAEVTRVLAPDCLKPHSTWVRFSKEIMLLSSASRPA